MFQLAKSCLVGKRRIGRLKLRYSDVCKREMAEIGIHDEEWEEVAENWSAWRTASMPTLGGRREAC